MSTSRRLAFAFPRLILPILLFAFETLACQSARASDAELDQLFEQLANPELENWEAVEEEILRRWTRSGSPTMDLLMQRGLVSMQNGDFDAAVAHFSALVDHAPDFAEGWNKRATAYFLMRRFALSMADIERTLALEPRHFGAISGLGQILVILGRREDALRVYEHLQTIHPHRQNVKEAIRQLRRAVAGTLL